MKRTALGVLVGLMGGLFFLAAAPAQATPVSFCFTVCAPPSGTEAIDVSLNNGTATTLYDVTSGGSVTNAANFSGGAATITGDKFHFVECVGPCTTVKFTAAESGATNASCDGPLSEEGLAGSSGLHASAEGTPQGCNFFSSLTYTFNGTSFGNTQLVFSAPATNQGQGHLTFSGTVVPEPSTYLSLLGGLSLLWSTRRRKPNV